MNDQFENNAGLRGDPRPDAAAPLSPAALPPYGIQRPTPSEFTAPPYGESDPREAAPYPFAGGQPPYRGGVPVRCPRCGNIVVTPTCGFCGSDLSQFYTFNGRALSAPGNFLAYPSYPPPRLYPPAQPYAASYQASPYVAPQKRERNRFAWAVVGLSLLALMAVWSGIFAIYTMTQKPLADNSIPGINPGGYPGPGASQDYFAPYGVSPAEYQQIKEGMSYALISQIIGGDGQLIDPTDPDAALESEYVIYGWPGELDPNASLYIKFVEGRAVEITAKGLEK